LTKLLWQLAAVAILALATFGQNPDYRNLQLKITQLSSNLYLIQDAGELVGGNMAVLVGDDGTLLVDDSLPAMSTKVAAAVKSISDRPVRFIFDTHFHGDHSGGNAALGRNALIFANENVPHRLRHPENGGVPNVLMSGNLELLIYGEKVRAVHYPAAHSDGDTAIFFDNAKVVHLGDLYFSGLLPFIDLDAGGSLDGLLKALDEIVATSPDNLRVIPGHGPLSDLKGLTEYVAMLRDSAAIIESGIRANKSLQQLQSEKVLGKYQRLEWEWGKLDEFTEVIYKDRMKKKGLLGREK
jgi:cyclase